MAKINIELPDEVLDAALAVLNCEHKDLSFACDCTIEPAEIMAKYLVNMAFGVETDDTR